MILGAIAVLVLVCVGVLSLGREHILFVIPTAAPAAATGFTAARRKSSSWRSASSSAPSLGRCRPPREASSPGSFRRRSGALFRAARALGQVTSFLAPLVVAIATAVFGTQAAAPAVLILFFLAGGLVS